MNFNKTAAEIESLFYARGTAISYDEWLCYRDKVEAEAQEAIDAAEAQQKVAETAQERALDERDDSVKYADELEEKIAAQQEELDELKAQLRKLGRAAK